MNQVLYRCNIPIHPNIRCICVGVSPHAAHCTARDTRTGHGCVLAQTMVLLFLAAPPHCCSAMFRAAAPQCKEYLEIHRNPHHIDSKGLRAVGKRGAAPFCRNALPWAFLTCKYAHAPQRAWRKRFLGRSDLNQETALIAASARARRVQLSRPICTIQH